MNVEQFYEKCKEISFQINETKEYFNKNNTNFNARILSTQLEPLRKMVLEIMKDPSSLGFSKKQFLLFYNYYHEKFEMDLYWKETDSYGDVYDVTAEFSKFIDIFMTIYEENLVKIKFEHNNSTYEINLVDEVNLNDFIKELKKGIKEAGKSLEDFKTEFAVLKSEFTQFKNFVEVKEVNESKKKIADSFLTLLPFADKAVALLTIVKESPKLIARKTDEDLAKQILEELNV